MSWSIQPKRAKVSKVEDKGKVVTMVLTTWRADKRKDPDNPEYIPTVTNAVVFGEASVKLARALKPGDKIKVIKGIIERNPYEKDGETKWPAQHTLKIFAFEYDSEFDGEMENASTQTSVPEMDEDEFPF